MRSHLWVPVLLLLVCSGCKSTGPERTARTVKTLEELTKDFGQLNVRIREVTKSLDRVVGGKDKDLQPPFEAFVAARKDLVSQAQTCLDHTQDLRENTDAYLEGWQEQTAQVKNPEIREKAKERREEAAKTFEEMRSQLSTIHDHYDKFQSDLADIEATLASDLTASGVEALTPLMKKTGGEQADLVRKDVGHIREVLEKVADTFRAKRAASGQ